MSSTKFDKNINLLEPWEEDSIGELIDAVYEFKQNN